MIIGLVGYKGSGKSEVAKALVGWRDQDGMGFACVKFAGPLKAMLGAYLSYVGVRSFGVDDILEGRLKEAEVPELLGRTSRYAMQTLGTEWGRDLIHQDIWIEAFKKRVANYKNVVCDDVRFRNEARAIEEMGGYLVRVDRGLSGDMSHQSEREISTIGYHVILKNDSTLALLRARARVLAIELESESLPALEMLRA